MATAPAAAEDLPGPADGLAAGDPTVQASPFGDPGDADVFDDLDAAIGAVFSSGPSTPAATAAPDTPAEAPPSHDDTAAQMLFASIAANYSRPVKNFIAELKAAANDPVVASIVIKANPFAGYNILL